jgi:hypothetical protein
LDFDASKIPNTRDAEMAMMISRIAKTTSAALATIDNAYRTVPQNLAGPHPAKPFKRLSGLEMLTIANERLKLFQGHLHALESCNEVLHALLGSKS